MCFHPLITPEKKLTGDQSFLGALTVSQVSSLDSEYTQICCVVQLLVSGQTQLGEFVPLWCPSLGNMIWFILIVGSNRFFASGIWFCFSGLSGIPAGSRLLRGSRCYMCHFFSLEDLRNIILFLALTAELELEMSGDSSSCLAQTCPPLMHHNGTLWSVLM